MGLLHLTVSENRVGLHMPVFDALGRPDGIVIHRGVRANEGRLTVEAVEYNEDDPRDEIIPIDYERKKIDFFNRDFVEACKDMIRKYGNGEFSRGVFFTVKGVKESETTVMFDFRIVTSRQVSAVLKPKKRPANSRITGKRSSRSSSSNKTDHSRKTDEARTQAQKGISAAAYNSGNRQNQAFSGFSMPAMARTF